MLKQYEGAAYRITVGQGAIGFLKALVGLQGDARIFNQDAGVCPRFLFSALQELFRRLSPCFGFSQQLCDILASLIQASGKLLPVLGLKGRSLPCSRCPQGCQQGVDQAPEHDWRLRVRLSALLQLRKQ